MLKHAAEAGHPVLLLADDEVKMNSLSDQARSP